jgi:hypothetical protein
MATTAPALFPGPNTFPGTNVYPGQGLAPIVRCRLSFSDVSVSTPVWTEVASNKFRSFSISRGRGSSFGTQFDAGTATVVLDNRDRAYDPNVNASVRPLNRIWLYSEFSGEVHDLFKGFAESWTLDWPDGGWSDAVAVVSCADEFKILNLDSLPMTSPLRSSFEDLIASDNPSGYWRLNQDPVTNVQAPTITEPNPVADVVLNTGGYPHGGLTTSGGFVLF